MLCVMIRESTSGIYMILQNDREANYEILTNRQCLNLRDSVNLTNIYWSNPRSNPLIVLLWLKPQTKRLVTVMKRQLILFTLFKISSEPQRLEVRGQREKSVNQLANVLKCQADEWV